MPTIWPTSFFSFSLYLWRVYKWLLRLLTRKCELLRICQGTPDLPARAVAVAQSLKYSKHKELRRIVDSSTPEEDVADPEDALKIIIKTKRISTEKHQNFVMSLRPCLLPIIALTVLRGDVEKLRSEQYSSDNIEHEQQLTKLWAMLMPQTELKGRYGNHWGTIGFQGKDPATDFRGMGILGLHCLVYFAEVYNGKARQVLGHSQHPSKGYPLAITSINMTSILYQLMMKGDTPLDYYFYNATEGRAVTLSDFMEAHCYIMYSFNKYWLDANPENIMAFSRIRDQFTAQLKSRLQERPITIQLTIE